MQHGVFFLGKVFNSHFTSTKCTNHNIIILNLSGKKCLPPLFAFTSVGKQFFGELLPFFVTFPFVDGVQKYDELHDLVFYRV